MGRRTSAARSIPGNALGGVMRATGRQARAATRRVARPVEEAQPQPETVAAATPFVGVVETNASGLAHFVFPATLDQAPVVAAVAVSDLPATVAVAWATYAAVALRVWDFDGNAVPTGTPVHVAVYPR